MGEDVNTLGRCSGIIVTVSLSNLYYFEILTVITDVFDTLLPFVEAIEASYNVGILTFDAFVSLEFAARVITFGELLDAFNVLGRISRLGDGVFYLLSVVILASGGGEGPVRELDVFLLWRNDS